MTRTLEIRYMVHIVCSCVVFAQQSRKAPLPHVSTPNPKFLKFINVLDLPVESGEDPLMSHDYTTSCPAICFTTYAVVPTADLSVHRSPFKNDLHISMRNCLKAT